MKTYFSNVQTLDELRKQYRDLLKKYHPDNGGSEEETIAIHVEYERLFRIIKDKHTRQQDNIADDKTDSKTSYDNMRYNFEEDELLREMLQKVIHLPDITIEIIGNWLWISGNIYQYRKELKELDFKFAGQKKSWYWHSDAFRKRSRKKLSMDDIRNYYGSTEVETDAWKRIGA